jgi:histone H3/H4
MAAVSDAAAESDVSKWAGLPRPRIDRALRKAHAAQRVSPGVSVYTTAFLETVFATILSEANGEVVESRKKRIGTASLMKAVRSHPELSKLFRNYTFFSGDRLKYDSTDLMTKADREAEQKRRQDAKKEKQRVDAAPAVDEE